MRSLQPCTRNMMSAGARKFLWTAVRWGVTIGCLALLFVWVPVDDTFSAVLTADPGLLLLAMLATVGNLALRGIRWTALLGRQSGRDIAVAGAVSVAGLALNATIPGKVGEIARIGMAVRSMKIRFGEAAMASVIERVIDLAVLSGLGFATISLTSEWGRTPDKAYSREALLALAFSLLVVSLVAATILLFASHDRLGKAARERIASHIPAGRWRRRFRRFSLDIRNGARRLRSRHTALPALAATLILWLILGLSVYLVGLAMPGVQCELLAAVAFAVVTTLASALPSAPGAWGVYEAAGMVVGAVLVQAESASTLAAFVIASHAVQYVPVVLIGLGCWVGLGRYAPQPR